MNTISEPSKLKAEVTYNAAADHFDDGPLAFWDRYGRRTVERLSLSRDRWCLMSDAVVAPPPYCCDPRLSSS